jgi:cell division ATPase FtsA
LKCQYGNANSQETIGQGGQSSIIEGVDDSVFHNIVQHRAGEIAFNIATQITQAGFKSTDLASGGIVIVGQGAKLQGFSQLLEFHTSLKVRNGIIATPIHITDGSIQPGNALDVIAILLAASKKEDVVNCIEGQSQPLPEPEVIIEYGTSQVEEKEEDVEEEYEDIPDDKNPKPAGPSTMQKVGDRLKSMLGKVQDTVADYLKEDGYEK